MSTEEAIHTIETSEIIWARPTEEEYEALTMAIEALKAQLDKIDCNHCVYMNPRTCDCDNFICKKYKRGANERHNL